MKYPPYKIETENLIIRCWNPSDVYLFDHAINNNIEHLQPWMFWIQFEPQSIDQRIEILRKFRSDFDSSKDYTYGIFTKDEKEVIGGTGLHTRVGQNAFEIGYWISKDKNKKGYAIEVASVLTYVAFNIDGIDRVEIRHDSENNKSKRIPERIGFTNEGTRRRMDFSFTDKVKDITIWTMIKSEYNLNSKTINVRYFDSIQREIKLC